MFLFFSFKVLTDHRIATHAKTPVQKAFGGGPREPPLCKSCMTRDTLLLSMLSAHRQRSQQAQPPVEAAHLAKRCSPCCGWPGAVIASTNAACQRNKAKASMQKKPGNATTDQRKGYPGTKGGHAYLVQNKSSKSDFLSAHLVSLEFCRTLNSRGTWACNQNRCPQ